MGETTASIYKHLVAVQKLLDSAITETYEELKNAGGLRKDELSWLLCILENADSYTISDLLYVMNYLKKQRTEGKLGLNSNGRYVLNDDELTCGTPVEIFIDDSIDRGWHFGRIEHSNKYGGYYFFNRSGSEHYLLKTGMKAAVRF